ncbi:MAG: hypothetical protein ABI304_07120 [Rudaea sp.]
MHLGPLAALLASLSLGTTVLPFGTLFANHANYNNRFLSVRGFVAIDELGHQYFFASLQKAKERKYSESIDIIPLRNDLQSVPALRNFSCAELYGKFESYGPHLIPMGYLMSNAGDLLVKRVSSCPHWWVIQHRT